MYEGIADDSWVVGTRNRSRKRRLALYRNRIVDPVRGVLPESVIKNIEEQLSGACTTEIAAFDEFTALLTDQELLKNFDHIIFDTAPTGVPFVCFQLPAAWSNFLITGKGDASCLGFTLRSGKTAVDLPKAVAVLSDPKCTRLILVARAQRSSLHEAARTHEELALVGLTQSISSLTEFCLRVKLRMTSWRDHLAARAIELQQLPTSLRKLPTDQIPLHPFNLVGVPSLRKLPVKSRPLEVVPNKTFPTLPAPPNLTNLVDGLASNSLRSSCSWVKAGWGKLLWPPPLP